MIDVGFCRVSLRGREEGLLVGFGCVSLVGLVGVCGGGGAGGRGGWWLIVSFFVV